MGARASHEPSAKEVFDRFNRSHSGKISLDEMASMAAASGRSSNMGVVLSIANSPLVLFHVDVTHEGVINYEEFEELQRNIQAVQRQIREQHRQRRPLLQRVFGCCTKASEPASASSTPARNHQPIRAFTTFTKSNRGGLNRSSTTPVFTSFKGTVDRTAAQPAAAAAAAEAGDSGGEEDGDDGSPKPPEPAELSEDAEITAEVVRKIVDDARSYFLSQLKNKEGREAYKAWLFRLTDVEHRGIITLDELRLILKAVERDGVRPQRLCFDLVDRRHAARAVMDEFASGRGYMTKGEFMVFGEIVLQEYEFAQKCMLRSHSVGKYRLTRLLGTGANGAVFYAFDMTNGQAKAVKIVKRGRVRDMSRLDTEIKAMGMLQHVNVVSLEEVLQTDDHVFLVMELCGGGTLYDAMPDDRSLSEPEARHFFVQIVHALRYCHGMGVCHRDLRLENILLDNRGVVKVSDFGHAGIFDAGWDMFSTTLVGSLYHISPEQIANRAYSGQRLDMWAAGITLYRLLTGQMPFHSASMPEFFAQVSSSKFDIPPTVTPAAADLLRKLLAVDPEQRPLPEEVLAHPWMRGECVAPPLLCVWVPVTVTDDETTMADLWGSIVLGIASQSSVVNERPADGPAAHSLPARVETVEAAAVSPGAHLQPAPSLSRAASMASGLHSMGTSGSGSDDAAGVGPAPPQPQPHPPAHAPHHGHRRQPSNCSHDGLASGAPLPPPAPPASAPAGAMGVVGAGSGVAVPLPPHTGSVRREAHPPSAAPPLGEPDGRSGPLSLEPEIEARSPPHGGALTQRQPSLGSASTADTGSGVGAPVTPRAAGPIASTAATAKPPSPPLPPSSLPPAPHVTPLPLHRSLGAFASPAAASASAPVPTPVPAPLPPSSNAAAAGAVPVAGDSHVVVVETPVPPTGSHDTLHDSASGAAAASATNLSDIHAEVSDVRLSLPVVRLAHCTDVAHNLKFIVRLRAGCEDPPANVWIEFQHVTGEIWRFRRVAQRLQARLSSSELDLLPEAPSSTGLAESDSMASLAQPPPPASRDLRHMLVSTDSLAPMRAVVRYGREPAPQPPVTVSRPPSVSSFGPLSRFPPGAERGPQPARDRRSYTPHLDGQPTALRPPVGR